MSNNNQISEIYIKNLTTNTFEKHHFTTEVDAIEDTTFFMKNILKSATSAQDVRDFIGAKEKNIITIVPSQNGSITYDGTSQSPVWDNYDTSKMVIGGTTSAVNAGTHTVTFTPLQDYQWSDKTIASKSVTWTINKIQIFAPEVTNTTKTYNEQLQAPTIATYDNTIISVSGDTMAINAGTYTLTISLIDTTNYEWTDGTTASKTVSWTINRAAISSVPSQSGTLTYNTNSQSPTWNNYNSAHLTLDGTTTGISAGTYTATFTPKSNYIWDDASGTEAKNVTWEIGKAAGAVTLSKDSITLNTSTMTDTFTYTRLGDGAVTVTSSDSTIATATDTSGTVTVEAVATGNITVTVSVAEGTNYLVASGTVSVAVQLRITKALNECTPAEIQEVVSDGYASEIWDVGDKTTSITLNGVVSDGLTLSNYQIQAVVLGFGHNKSVETNNKDSVHFALGIKDGKDIAFCDSGQGHTYSSGNWFNHQNSASNYGGWNASLIRTVVLPKFKNALPSAWQSIIGNVTKWTDNTGNGPKPGAGANNITATTDTLFIPAEFEVSGVSYYANSQELNKQLQYQYYANGNSKIRYKHSDTSSACNWWLRSVYYTGSTRFLRVTDGGSIFYNDAHYSNGIVPCFVVNP